MHMVEAIIKPERLEAVKAALQSTGIQGLTVCDARGYGRQLGATESYRGATVQASFVHKVLIKVVVSADDSARVCETIMSAARSGEVGDGKIFVYPVSRVYRIRTGERDRDAL